MPPPPKGSSGRSGSFPGQAQLMPPTGPSASFSCSPQTETEQLREGLCGSPPKAPEPSRGTFSQRKAVGLKSLSGGTREPRLVGRGGCVICLGIPPCIEWGWSGCPQGFLLTLGFGSLISLGSVGGPECFPEGDHGGGDAGTWGFRGALSPQPEKKGSTHFLPQEEKSKSN